MNESTRSSPSTLPPKRDRATRVARAVASALLLALSLSATIGAIVAHWSDSVLLDTDTFMAAIEPIAHDETALASTADQVTTAIVTRIDIAALADYLPEPLRPLLQKTAGEFEAFVREQVGAAVATEAYADLWRSDMRAWHASLAAAVKADPAEAAFDGSDVRVSLGPYIDLLAENAESELLRSALGLVPDEIRQTEVAVVSAGPFAEYLPVLRRLDAARPYLPWLALIALVAGVLVAPRRDVAVACAGAGFFLTGAVAPLALGSWQSGTVNMLSTTLGVSVETGAVVVGTLTAPLMDWLGYLMFAGVLMAAAGLTPTLIRLARAARPPAAAR